MELDQKWLNAYTKWLKRHNDLTDCAWRVDGKICRWDNHDLERFRNDPARAFVEKLPLGSSRTYKVYRGSYKATGNALAAHLVSQLDQTIWMTNSGKDDTLL